jgi:hypothetical protein
VKIVRVIVKIIRVRVNGSSDDNNDDGSSSDSND